MKRLFDPPTKAIAAYLKGLCGKSTISYYDPTRNEERISNKKGDKEYLMAVKHLKKTDQNNIPLEILGKLYTAAVIHKHEHALYTMGCLYLLREHTIDQKPIEASEQTTRKGVGFIEQAARSGVKEAMYPTGMFYLQGTVRKKDAKEAFEMFRLGFTIGCTLCACKLALCYLKGIGTDINLPKASFICHWICDSEDVRVCDDVREIGQEKYMLGMLYENGIPSKHPSTNEQYVYVDLKVALMYYKTAATEGCFEALIRLAKMYETGTFQRFIAKDGTCSRFFVSKNPHKAALLYTHACPHPKALLRLSKMFRDGNLEVKKNPSLAQKLLSYALDRLNLL